MYWVDFLEDPGPDNPEFIGHAASSDGRNWSERSRVTIENLSGVKAVDPSVVELKDGRLRMFYYLMEPFIPLVHEEIPHKILSAISSGGEKTFIEGEGVRFQAPGITDPDVIQKPDGLWIMYLSRGQETLIATSRNGLDFEDASVVIQGGGVPGAAVLEDGRIRLFVTTPGGIRSLISQDEVHFQPEPSVRISSTTDAPIVADPSVSRTPDGQWVMAFKRRLGNMR